MATTTNPTPQPEPPPQPRPVPTPDPATNPGQQPVVPPPATPTQEELDAMAEGNYDPLAPEGQRVKKRSMDPAKPEAYPTR